MTIREEFGDYDLRTPDYDTALVGAITERIIDADAMVRDEWSNGLPNWQLYRAALAGDSLYIPMLRRWCVAFAVAHCECGGIRKDAYSEELACVAAWDALHLLLFTRELASYTVLAEMVGVDKKTYKRLRDALYRRLRASLTEYWDRLGAAYRIVCIRYRSIKPLRGDERGRWSQGRGFGHEIDVTGSGNFRAKISGA